MNFEFLTKIIAVTLNHQPYIGDAWCAGSAIYCIIEVSDILNIIPRSEWDVIILRRITLYCRYNMIFMNIVMVPMMKSWHQDEMPQYYSAHCSCHRQIQQNANCFHNVFVFQKLTLLCWRRMDVGGGSQGEEQRKGKKEKILKVTTDSNMAAG